MLQLCSTLGIPVTMDKLEGPSTMITYLGIELDSQWRELRLPPAKLNDLFQELESWFGCRKTSKRRLLIDWKTIFCSQGGTCWLPIPTTPHQPIYNSQPTPPPYYTKQPCLGRHSVVAPVPSSMEWKGHVPRHNLCLSPRSPVLHRRIW